MADLYAAITDDAVNRIINFVHARAPYLFNYVAPSVRIDKDQSGNLVMQDLWVTCSPVPDTPRGIPKYRRIPPFQLPGIAVKLPCSIQLIDLTIDFHPGDIVTLPAQLNPPLAAQRFALNAMVQFGLACVPPEAVRLEGLSRYGLNADYARRLEVLPVDSLECFLIQIFAIGHLFVETKPPTPTPLQNIRVAVDGLEIVDIEPKGLEQAVECYLVAMLKGAILPEIVLGLERIPVNALGIQAVTPSLTPGLPNNPAVEQNELRVWLDLAFS